jgi:DNA invertase Pin-like site-specific DNA recombinase
MTNLRVATYCRISDDRGGQGLGVERQREDCEKLVDQRGWTLAGRYVDNDLSAYSGRPRPDYLRMLDAIRGGLVDAVVAWHPDRLHRSPSELEDFLTIVEQHNVTVETVRAGKWDLSSPSGRMTARILGSVARGESEHKSDRVRRALEQRATMGTSHGRIAYGWTRTVLPDGSKVETVNEPQAELVRSLALRIVAGESLRSIVTDLNSRGIPSPTGKPWGKTMLRAVVTRERNVGLRVHRGEVVGMGTWPPILERALWDQVRAVLSDPSRKTSGGSAAVHLLSGIARCGVCDGPVRASMNRQTPSYRCADRACVSRNRQDVDAFVVDVVLARLQRADVVDLLKPPDGTAREAAAEVAQIRARLDLAADSFAEGEIDAQQLHRITERLRPRLEAAQALARVVDDSPMLDGLVGAPDAREVWEGLPLSRQRGIVDLLMTVRILRAAQGARTFDPASVAIEWRTS